VGAALGWLVPQHGEIPRSTQQLPYNEWPAAQ
jgi:hypothetical protein